MYFNDDHPDDALFNLSAHIYILTTILMPFFIISCNQLWNSGTGESWYHNWSMIWQIVHEAGSETVVCHLLVIEWFAVNQVVIWVLKEKAVFWFWVKCVYVFSSSASSLSGMVQCGIRAHTATAQRYMCPTASPVLLLVFSLRNYFLKVLCLYSSCSQAKLELQSLPFY